MKVLVVNTVEFATNGITTVILNLFQGINKEKIKMDFVATCDSDFDFKKKIIDCGAKVYFVARNSNPFLYLFKLVKLLKTEKYDVIHIHGNSATMSVETVAALIAGVPVRIVHSHSVSCTHMKLHKLLSPILGLTYTHGIACSEAAGNWLFNNKNYKIINNSVDLDKYSYNSFIRNKKRKELKVDNCFVIGHVGNYYPEKNHLFLLNVLAEIIVKKSDIRLLLVGTGPLKDEIISRINELGLEQQIILAGQVDNVEEYMQAMDVFVFPSFHEGFGVALLEAMASGLSCGVSDVIEPAKCFSTQIDSLSIEKERFWVDYLLNLHDKCNLINREEVSRKMRLFLEDSGYSLQNNTMVLENLYEDYFSK